MGFCKMSRFIPIGSGKSTAFMTEKFTLKECLGEGRAVERYKWEFFTGASRMDLLGRDFFAGSRFALNKNRSGAMGGSRDEGFKCLHGKTLVLGECVLGG